MAPARSRRSDSDRAAALIHVGYELEMCAEAATRVATGAARDGVEHNAYLEACLLHARNLFEFLVAERSSPRLDDLLTTDFTSTEWSAQEELPYAVQRLKAAREDLNKHLSHLTWVRVDDGAQPQWTPLQMAHDIAEVVGSWAAHVRLHDRSGAGATARTLEAHARAVALTIAEASAPSLDDGTAPPSTA